MERASKWWELRKTGSIPPTLPKNRSRRYFSRSCKSPRARRTWWCENSRDGRDPGQVAAAIRSKLRGLDAGLPSFIQTWNEANERRAVWIAHGDGCRWVCLVRWERCFRSQGFLAWLRIQLASGSKSWGFGWLLARSGKKCCRRGWGEHSNCSQLVRRGDWCWGFLRQRFLRLSCIRRRRAIR